MIGPLSRISSNFIPTIGIPNDNLRDYLYKRGYQDRAICDYLRISDTVIADKQMIYAELSITAELAAIGL